MTTAAAQVDLEPPVLDEPALAEDIVEECGLGSFRQAIRQAGGPRAKSGVLAGGRSDAFRYEFADRVGHELDRDRGQQQARDTDHQLDAGLPEHPPDHAREP